MWRRKGNGMTGLKSCETTTWPAKQGPRFLVLVRTGDESKRVNGCTGQQAPRGVTGNRVRECARTRSIRGQARSERSRELREAKTVKSESTRPREGRVGGWSWIRRSGAEINHSPCPIFLHFLAELPWEFHYCLSSPVPPA
jgi:hypothetical protein